jgi:plasmid stabilization system protein ParE
MNYTIRWTDRAKQDVQNIIDFILVHWESAIVSNFLDLIDVKIGFILKNPYQNMISKHYTNSRKIIIHTHITLFYTIDEDLNEVILLSFFDTRQNPNKI